MKTRWRALGVIGSVVLAACSAPPPAALPSGRAATAPAPPPPAPELPVTLDGYKKAFAAQVARASAEVYDEPVPEMLKSIVVLEVTIGRDGSLRKVAVRRSNGYLALEQRALDSVRRAAPFAAPARSVLRADGTVSFLETFLFRGDGRFRIRSLVAAL